MEYTLVRKVDQVSEFSEAITSLMENGWVLYGNPFATTWVDTNENESTVYTEYCQALTRVK